MQSACWDCAENGKKASQPHPAQSSTTLQSFLKESSGVQMSVGLPDSGTARTTHSNKKAPNNGKAAGAVNGRVSHVSWRLKPFP
jgi:hypothetical protein